MAALAFAFCAVWGLTANAQEEARKTEAKQRNGEAKLPRHELWQVGDDIGLIDKVDAEKKTITIKEEGGEEHTLAIDEVTVRDFRGTRINGFDEKQLRVGAMVGWKPDNKGKIAHIFVGMESGTAGRAKLPLKKDDAKKVDSKAEKTSDKVREEKK
jgi:hypothetical protein